MPEVQEKPTTTSMARGTLLLMIGQMVFMAAGYAINILLARTLGPAHLGLFGISMAILLWFEFFVINGLPTAMQHYIPAGKFDAVSIIKSGLKLQLIYCAAVFAGFVAVTPLFSQFFHDPRLTELLWLASADILVYGLYWLYIGILSGERRFSAQAVTTLAYALGKLAAIVLLLKWGFGVRGALVGNWMGSAIGLLFGVRFVKTGSRRPFNPIDTRELLQYARPVVVYTLLMNLLLYLDIFFVKKFMADADVGFYHIAGTLARIPYFIFIGLSFTLLPVLSRAIGEKNLAEAQRLIVQVIRFLLILLTPTVIFIWQNAQPIIRLLYSSEYDPAVKILPVLTLALVLYTLFYLATTVLNADKKPGFALKIALLSALVDLVANWLWVPRYGTVGAAAATGMAALIGLLGCGIYVFRRFRFSIRFLTLVRIAGANAVVAFLLAFWPTNAIEVLPKALIFTMMYIGLLILTREINGEDWAAFRRASIKRKAKTQPQAVR